MDYIIPYVYVYTYLYICVCVCVSSTLQVDAVTEKKVKAVDAELKAKEKDIMS
jgi:hypothetical protein